MSETYTVGGGRSDYRLPTVNTSDNGKVLKVVEGEWKKAEGGGGSDLPEVTAADAGQVLTVSDEGEWVAAAPGGGGGGLTLYGPYTARVSSAGSVSAGAMEDLTLDNIQDNEGTNVYLPADGSGVYFFITNMGSLLQGLVTLAVSAPKYFESDNTWDAALMTVENISDSTVNITEYNCPYVEFYSTAELSAVAPNPET